MLLHFRNTPHRMTGRTPSSLLMNREVKTKLPGIEQQTNDETETRGGEREIEEIYQQEVKSKSKKS
jgi:hypothetical protein